MNSQPDTDEWVVRLRHPEQQEAALVELRTVVVRGLRKAFAGKGGGEAFCEDIAQETLIRILEKLDQFAGRSRFTTWVMSIAIRIGTSQFRRKMFKDVSLNSVDSDENMKFQFEDRSAIAPDDAESRKAMVAELRSLIEKNLTDKQRQATEAILHGMPVEEIAARSGSNRNAVYKLIHDARMRLRQGLETAGYSAEDMLTVFA